MTIQTVSSPDGKTITVRIPFAVRKRGGQKLVIVPEGAPAWAPRARVDNVMIKALARAFRWRRLLEAGTFGTVEELAAAENINPSYVSRVLRITSLAPEMVEAILDGRQPTGLTLATLMKPFPVEWQEQAEGLRLPVASNGRPTNITPVTAQSSHLRMTRPGGRG